MRGSGTAEPKSSSSATSQPPGLSAPMSRRSTVAVGQPRQQQARVDDIELALGQVVLEHVMGPHVEVRVRYPVEHRGVPIGRHDDPVGGHAVGQPPGDRAASGAHLQAAPPASDAAGLELGDRPGVEERLEGPQPLTLCLRVFNLRTVIPASRQCDARAARPCLLPFARTVSRWVTVTALPSAGV